MSKKILKCVVVGLGRIGWQLHIPQVMNHSGFELYAVVDPDRQRLEEAQDSFGVNNLYQACEEITDLSNIDLAIIASPTAFHASQSQFFLKNKVDVFCDKPIASSHAEAKSMAQCAREHNQKLMVFQPHRLTTEALTAQEIIRIGLLGDIYMIQRSVDNYCRRNDWQAFRANGGGMLFNYGTHFIDQLFYLTADSCKRAECEQRSIATLGDADDVVSTLITGQNDILYKLDINMAAAINNSSIKIYGKYGAAMSYNNEYWKVRYCKPDELPQIDIQSSLAAKGRRYPSENIKWHETTFPVIQEDRNEYYRRCYNYFALDHEPLVPISETLEVMRTIELCQSEEF